MGDRYASEDPRVLADLRPRRRQGAYIATRPGEPLDRVLVAHGAGWPDPLAALADAEIALGGQPWVDATLLDRVAACQIACEEGLRRASLGGFSGTPLAPAALFWLETALDELGERLG